MAVRTDYRGGRAFRPRHCHAAKHFGLDYVVLEQGSLVDGIARFPINMVFFTTPELLEIGGLPLTTPYEKPTRAEALRYYRKVVDMFQLQVSMFERVVSIQPPETPGEPFAVESRTTRGVTRIREARNVVLAMGYYDLPNLLSVPGEDLPHVTHFYKEAHYRQRVVIVAARTRPRKRRSKSTAPAVTSRWCIAGQLRRVGEMLGEADIKNRKGRIDQRALQCEGRRDSRMKSCSIPARRFPPRRCCC